MKVLWCLLLFPINMIVTDEGENSPFPCPTSTSGLQNSGHVGSHYTSLKHTVSSSVPSRISYSRYSLMKMRYKNKIIEDSIVKKLKALNIFKYRGKRAGQKLVRTITTTTTMKKHKHLARVSADRSTRHVTAVKLERKRSIVDNLPKLLVTNPQSLTNCFDEFTSVVNEKKPHFISVSETWFSENKPAHLFELENYTMYHKDRPTRAGGVAAYIHESLRIKDLHINVPTEVECVWVGIQSNIVRNIKLIALCTLYHPPAATTHDLLIDHITTTVDSLRSRYSNIRIVILGDCNNLDTDLLCRDLNLTCIIDKPTHDNSILDKVLTDINSYSSFELLPPVGLSRHRCILVAPAARPPPPSHTSKLIRPWLDSSVREFGQWITTVDWGEIKSCDDPDEATEMLQTILQQQYERCFPQRTLRTRSDNKPWMTARILHIMDQRRRAYDRGNMEEWRRLYFKIKNEIKIAKSETANKIEENNRNSAQFSKELKCIFGNSKKKIQLPMFDNMNDHSVGNQICNHFTNICTSYPPLNNCELPSYLPFHPNDLPEVDRISVYKKLLSLKTSKASPPDQLPKRLLKEFAYEISEPLTFIFNLCLQCGIFPKIWKKATIIPLKKKNVVHDLGDIRPISLTPDFSKIFEYFIAKVTMNDIHMNIDRCQYGNMEGCSTTHYLVKLLDFVYKGLDSPNNLAAITLIDFKKAFDLVDHSVAVRELYLLGCRSSLIPVIIGFLSNRQHQVMYGETLSDWQNTSCGVPQGTRLGPIIFLAIVNGVAKHVPLHVKFVDDLSLAEIVNTSNSLYYTSQQSLDDISTECSHVHMTTNPLKCEVLIVSPPKRPIVYPSLLLNDIQLPVVSEVKLLGVHINSGLNWNTHVNYLISKVNKCMFILYRAKQFQFSINTLYTLYVWFIRTSLEFAVPVWHPGLTSRQTQMLERIQKRCFKIILGPQYQNYETAQQIFNTTSLQARRVELCRNFASNLIKSNRHRSLLPPAFNQIHTYNTRRGSTLLPSVRCKTSRYHKSSVPYLVRLLNSHELS